MPFPFLAGFLEVKSSDGSCVEVFNSCRARWNVANRAESATSDWCLTDSENNSISSNCCCWAWDEGDYSLLPDPWFDASNPATREVAGVIVDGGDNAGHGFFVEPSSSSRVLGANGFVPLEMFVTFTVVAGSARGERAFLNWLDSVLRDACNRCNGLELSVFTECPCEDDFLEAGLVFEDGCPIVVLPDSQPPAKGGFCDAEPECLVPYDGPQVDLLDSGERQILRVDYVGIEPLLERIDNCSGNRYRVSFEIGEHCWYSAPRHLWDIGEFSDCECLCTGVHGLCDDCGPVDLCGDGGSGVLPSRSSIGSLVLDNADGVIGVEGRYSRPEFVMLDAELTPPMPSSVNSVLSFDVVNDSVQDVYDLRLVVWEAIDGAPRPDTEVGWKIYQEQGEVYSLPVVSLLRGDRLSVTASGDVSLDRSGISCSAGSIVDAVNGCLELSCGLRYWVGLEVPCGYDADGVSASVSVAFKESI